MSYDPIANTISDPVPPCPFCGGETRPNAIGAPPYYRWCQGCGAQIPAQHYKALCVAMEGAPKAQKLIDQARELRWQLRLVLEFIQAPPAELLRQAGTRYAVLIEAWRLTKGEV